MKNAKRALAIVLTILMLPLVSISASAETANYGNQDFESLAVGKPLETGDGFGSVPAISYAMEEEDGNSYARIPFVGEEGTSSTSNWDKSLTVNHAAMDRGESFTFEVRYRPHFNGADAAPTVEAQFLSYRFNNPSGKTENGIFMNLYKIDLATGQITGCGELVPEAKGLNLDEWNTVKLVFYPESSSFRLYVNGVLYSVQTSQPHVSAGFTNSYQSGCSDVVIGANQLILAKCNKNRGAYVTEANKDGASYLDVDDFCVYETPKIQYTMNGVELFVGEGSILNLAKGSKRLLWANIELANGEQYTTDDPWIAVEEGMKINSAAVDFESVAAEARLCKPLGLRFVTQVNLADLEALRATPDVKEVEVGTVILPTLSVKGIGQFTHDILKKVGRVLLPMKDWYSVDEENGTATYAASLANIKEENYNREYSGVGYLKVVFEDDSEMFVYASSAVDSKNSTSLTAAAGKQLSSGKVKGEAKKAMQELKDQYNNDTMALYGKDLQGLNVLALGDSLFSGTNGYPQNVQWVNKLGIECGWNLTNLGTSSMTVSWTERNNDSAHGNKNSMYDWLFNGKNDFCWGSTSKHRSPNPFFHTGNPDRDHPEKVDLIILEGGCNDYGTAIAAPLGTVDSKDPATFLGAWNCVTERLLEIYPNATIVFLTTWRLNPQTRDGDALTSIEFSESVIELYNQKYADNVRISLINAGNPEISGVDMFNKDWKQTYSTDSYHLKDSGMAVMANNMLPLLWQILKNTGKI